MKATTSILVACGALVLGVCATHAASAGERSGVAAKLRSGQASYYGPGFHGRRTASGERFNQWALTAAHPSLPMGSRVRVTNQRNGKSVTVRINDRGPHVGGRVIDLSTAARNRIAMGGTAPVTLERVR